MAGKLPGGATPELNLTPDNAEPEHAHYEGLTSPAQEAADDSLVGALQTLDPASLANIDAALDMLVSTPDIADVPMIDWDSGS